MPKGIYQRDPIVRQQRSQKFKALWADPIWREKMLKSVQGKHVSWNRGMKMLEKYPHWGMTGKRQSELWRRKFDRTGQQASIETKMKLRESHNGNKHYNWKGGKLSLRNSIRKLAEYHEWRKSVLLRDNYKCLKCHSSEYLTVDHIISMRTIVKEFEKIYSNLHWPTDRVELIHMAREWKPFWDTSNGRTWCFSCHTDR